MDSIDWYLENSVYKDSGRGPVEVDCYGLVRLVRHHVFGLDLLPLHPGVNPREKDEAAPRLRSVVAGMSSCDPHPGAFVLAFTASIGGHCAVVVERNGAMGVLECDEGVNARWVPLKVWRRLWSRLEFYL